MAKAPPYATCDRIGDRRSWFDGLLDQFLPGKFDPPNFAPRLAAAMPLQQQRPGAKIAADPERVKQAAERAKSG
jgi:3-hydroxyisobutyrate dehydrogenase